MSGWIAVEEDDREFTGPYDTLIEKPHADGQGGTMIGACWREHGPLFAAAPELLEALILARELFVDGNSACAEICDEAIAKAMGDA